MADETGWSSYEAVSTDHGATWGWPALRFGEYRFPHVAVSPDGEILRSAWKDGAIAATFQYPGEAFASPPWLFSGASGVLAMAEDHHCVAWSPWGR